MKTTLTFLLVIIGFGAMAQRSSYRKEVTNNGHELRIRVDVEQPGRSVHYQRSFDVADLDDEAVKALQQHVLDSLGVSDGPAAPPAGRHRTTQSVTSADTPNRPAVTREPIDLLALGETTPSSVRHQEDKENARLWMQYVFERNGEAIVFERTVNVAGKSEHEKKQIIRDTERSIGLKPTHQ